MSLLRNFINLISIALMSISLAFLSSTNFQAISGHQESVTSPSPLGVSGHQESVTSPLPRDCFEFNECSKSFDDVFCLVIDKETLKPASDFYLDLDDATTDYRRNYCPKYMASYPNTKDLIASGKAVAGTCKCAEY